MSLHTPYVQYFVSQCNSLLFADYFSQYIHPTIPCFLKEIFLNDLFLSFVYE